MSTKHSSTIGSDDPIAKKVPQPSTPNPRVAQIVQQNDASWRAGKIRAYYTQLMPMTEVCEWLTQQGDVTLKEYEFALFRNNNIVVNRHAHFSTVQEMRQAFEQGIPEKLDVGHQWAGGNKNLARFLLAFDLDADDYEIVYTAFEPANALQTTGPQVIRPSMWNLLVMSARVLDHFLQFVIFKDAAHAQPLADNPIPTDPNILASPEPYRSMAVFSGRRGIHLWIFNRFRDAFNIEEIKQLSWRVHHLRTALGAAEFLHVLQQQNSDGRHDAFLSQVEAYAREALCSSGLWNRSRETIDYLEQELALMLDKDSIECSADYFLTLQQESENKNFWQCAGLMLLAPRLDENVTTSTNHLLKVPFAVHPASLCVSTPFNLYPDTLTNNEIFENVCISLDDLYGPAIFRRTQAQQKFLAAVQWFRQLHGLHA